MGERNELVLRVFAASENDVKPIKTAVEVETDLKIELKLKIDDRNIPDHFKIPHGWMNKDEGMEFWSILLFPDIFNYLTFFPSELGSKDLNDYKISKAYSSHKSGWLQPLLYHNFTGTNFCILKGECRKSHSVNNSFKSQPRFGHTIALAWRAWVKRAIMSLLQCFEWKQQLALA